MAIITSTDNAGMYIQILDTFLILLIENRLGDNPSFHRTKSIKVFCQERLK